MTASIAFSPYLTSNAAGSFNVTSTGLYQGTAFADPVARFALTAGLLGPNETLPMWGGVGISDVTAPVASSGVFPHYSLGGYVTRATNISAVAAANSLTGFSVFDQAHAMVNTPQSPVPLAGSGAAVNYYRLGSGARIALAADPSLITLDGNIVTQRVSWDFVNQRVIPYTAGYAAVTITNAAWANTSGGQTTYTVSTDMTTVLSAGSDINVAGVVSTGGTGLGFNGSFTVLSVTSTTVVVSQAAASSPGTYSSGGSILAAGGAIPGVKVLDVQASNCKTVVYAAGSGFATWNNNGACVVLQI